MVRSYKDIRRHTRTLGGIPKTALTLEGEKVSSVIFEMHKIAKQAANYQRERTRLTNGLRDNTSSLKALKKRFETLKEELKTAPEPFLQEKNGKQKSLKSSFSAEKQTKAKSEVGSLNKFFEFNMEY